MAIHESRALLPTITVRAFIRGRTTMPSADFCCGIKASCDALSHDSATHSRSPEVSSTAFRTQPPNLQPVPLMDMGFAVIGQLARHRMPQIRFLYIGSYVCSTLLSDPPSPKRPCASLSLHLHQVVKRTFTFELSNMLGTPKKGGPEGPPQWGRVQVHAFLRDACSTRRWLFTLKTPKTPFALMKATFRSISVATTPSSVTSPFFTTM